jgi:hypothetical protein
MELNYTTKMGEQYTFLNICFILSGISERGGGEWPLNLFGGLSGPFEKGFVSGFSGKEQRSLRPFGRSL